MGESSLLPDPARVDPGKLTVLLTEAGWQLVGGRRGIYNRFAPPGDEPSPPHGALIIPLDADADDYSEQMIAALKELASAPYQDAWIRIISPRLSASNADRFSFRKESAAPSGLIPWASGEDLIASARQSLLAGAKAHLETARHYGNRLGQFARRYLETVLMGQTAPGSYIVTAYAPAEAAVPIKGGAQDDLGYEGVTSANGRNINLSIVHALEAATEAVDFYRSTGSFTAFDDAVRRGISYELTKALKGITGDSDGADITVEWDPLLPVESGESVTRFEFRGSDADVFDKAARRLIAPDAPRPIEVIGRVHLLTRKQAGAPGVVGIETFGGGQPRKLRVRMESQEDYNQAVEAHRRELAVKVSGTLTREGNLNWLYNAHLDDILGSIEDFMQWDTPDPPMDEPFFDVINPESTADGGLGGTQ